MSTSLVIGMVVFNHFTALDLFGPQEVFSWFPHAKVLIIGPTEKTVTAESGVKVVPDFSFEKAPQLDLIFVPGGSGVNQVLSDQRALGFIRSQAPKAKYFASVCTGALVLGASGLLKGYRASTHWASMEFLKEFGAIPSRERFVIDRNRFTGGGVTAGIDLALKIAHEIFSAKQAQMIQLMLEYNPKPEFPEAGSPSTANPGVLNEVQKMLAPLIEERRKAVSGAKRAL